ncbi:hypothetical protein SMICM304S_00014 [Streptomyces microflavus]
MGTHAVTSSFKGSVHYEAHGGVLDIKLSDVKVLTVGKAGKITVDVTTKSPGKDAVVTDDLAMANLDLTDVTASNGAEGMKFAAIPATFTKEGAAVFGSAYKEGDPVDPATLTVKQAAPPSTRPSTPGRPAREAPGQAAGQAPRQADPHRDRQAGQRPGRRRHPRLGPQEVLPLVRRRPDRARQGRDERRRHGQRRRLPLHQGHRPPRCRKEHAQRPVQGQGALPQGHETNGAYELDLSFSNLKVDVQGTTGKLVADVSTKDRASGKVNTYTGLTFADLKVPAGALAAKEGVVNLKGIPATLTEDGSKAFSGMYKKGEELDALTTAVSLDKDATLPPGGSTGTRTAPRPRRPA